MAATPSPRPVRPRPSVVVAETVTGAPSASDSACLGLRAARPEARPVADHLHGHVADLEARGPDPTRGLPEQRDAGRARPGRLRGAEVGAQVAQPGWPTEGVAGGVRRDVGVGVTLETLRLVRPGQAGEVERHPLDEPVDVGADADAGEARGSLHPVIMPEQQSGREDIPRRLVPGGPGRRLRRAGGQLLRRDGDDHPRVARRVRRGARHPADPRGAGRARDPGPRPQRQAVPGRRDPGRHGA